MSISEQDTDNPKSSFSGSGGLNTVFSTPEVAAKLSRTVPPLHDAASEFWQSALDSDALSPRMRELVLIALHGTITSLNTRGTRRHIERALEMGASQEDILDVLFTIVGISNHALYFSLPVLMEQIGLIDAKGAELPEMPEEARRIKEEFIKERGVWNEQRDIIARLMPRYFTALSRFSTTSWKHGSLTRKERELICIAIDCTVTHMFKPGLALHIRGAMEHGATREEILAVFELASVTGLESFILGAEALYGEERIA